MSRIGLFGGCFNPPSNIHINLAKEIINKFNLDKLVFVPVGDYYKKEKLERAIHRYNMLGLATSKEKKIEVNDIELKINKELYASDIFAILSEEYRNDEIYLIMGSDNFIQMPKWKDYENIIKLYKYIVIEREGYISKLDTRENNILIYHSRIQKNIDSTRIRKMIKEDKNIDKLINKDVYEYIKKNNIYTE